MSSDTDADDGRRNFLKGAAAVATGIASGSNSVRAESTRPGFSASGSVMDLIAPKMETVRFGLIGSGLRGRVLLRILSNIDGARVAAVCDIDNDAIDLAKGVVADSGRAQPEYFTGGDYAYRDLLQSADLDAIVIATPWRWHTPMARDTMEAGKHAFVEVPMGVTLDDLWQLVETSETTNRNCMMMENVCYGRSEMMALNMVRQGVLGELLHGEGAYIHDLRDQLGNTESGEGVWRPAWHARQNANLYPTHGLGPIAQYMNINRGDRFDYMTSMSSPALGRDLYAARHVPADHEHRTYKYIAGDMNTSLIKTIKGRTILVQHDTTSPRPYSRLNLIQGTNGTFAGFPDRIAIEQVPEGVEVDDDFSHHRWDTDMEKWRQQFEHPLWRRLETDATLQGGHGGMDFVMLWRAVYCLRNGVPLDQNVYDGAAWSSIRPLSELSLSNRSASADIPDFTGGAWKTATALDIA